MTTQELNAADPSQSGSRPTRKIFVLAAVAGTLVAGGTTAAFAATDTAKPAAAQQGKSGPPAGGPREAFGLGAPLHGEMVVAQVTGTGTKTIVTQSGTVTAAGASSVTVKSTDGFQRSYVLSPKTVTGPPDAAKIAVKVGDKIMIAGLKEGETLTAIRLGPQSRGPGGHGDHGGPHGPGRDADGPGRPGDSPAGPGDRRGQGSDQ